MSAGEAGRHVVAFLDFFIDGFLEVQDKKSLNIVSNRLYCLWASFMVQHICFQGDLPKTYFPTSWRRHESDEYEHPTYLAMLQADLLVSQDVGK